MASWFVYLARCADGTLYCGVARDVAARIAMHDAGTGAKYTRSRGPLVVLLVRRCRDHGAALRLEHAIKQLPRARKLELVEQPARIAALIRRGRPRARPRPFGDTGARGSGSRSEHPGRRPARLPRGRRAARGLRARRRRVAGRHRLLRGGPPRRPR